MPQVAASDAFFNLYRHGFARVAVATPALRVGDPAYNAAGTLALMRQAARDKARHFAEKAKRCLDIFPDSQHKDALRSLAEFIVERDS